jgi:hypothetical protein
MGYTTQIIVTHYDLPTVYNQPKPSQNPLILQGFQTPRNREHDYHDSCILYRGLCPIPTSSDFISFQLPENLHVAMPTKAQSLPLV